MFDLLGYLIVALICWSFPQPAWAKFLTQWVIKTAKALYVKLTSKDNGPRTGS